MRTQRPGRVPCDHVGFADHETHTFLSIAPTNDRILSILDPDDTRRGTLPEHDVMRRTPGAPATTVSLAQDLRRLGLRSGDVVIVHTSLSALGWVVGGAVAVVRALEAVLGRQGTLVMPTQTTGLSDPSTWENPPAPPTWLQVIRDTMPPYDPSLTPTARVGVVPETFRKHDGVIRSSHPLYSFAARGPHAEQVVAAHDLHDGLGDGSPLGALYGLDARVLLLGVDHSANTSLHLCEYRLPVQWRDERRVRLPVGTDDDGITQWHTVDDIRLNSDDFDTIGRDLMGHDGAVAVGRVGAGAAQLMRQRVAVDHGIEWMQRHRNPIR